MSWHVRLEWEVRTDLRQIQRYVMDKSREERVAHKTIANLRAAIGSLSDYPLARALHPLLEDVHVRYETSGNWVILFHVDEHSRIVSVLRVVHRYRHVQEMDVGF